MNNFGKRALLACGVATIAMLAQISGASAGQLFPPYNATICGETGILSWIGSAQEGKVGCVSNSTFKGLLNITDCGGTGFMKGVKNGVATCATPTADLGNTITCPNGKYLAGINGTTPVCKDLPTSGGGGEPIPGSHLGAAVVITALDGFTPVKCTGPGGANTVVKPMLCITDTQKPCCEIGYRRFNTGNSRYPGVNTYVSGGHTEWMFTCVYVDATYEAAGNTCGR